MKYNEEEAREGREIGIGKPEMKVNRTVRYYIRHLNTGRYLGSSGDSSYVWFDDANVYWTEEDAIQEIEDSELFYQDFEIVKSYYFTTDAKEKK